MDQAAEDCAKSPDELTFSEFCERCCESCRIVRWLGEDSPPSIQDEGSYYSERRALDIQRWSLSCPMCQQIRQHLDQWLQLSQPARYQVSGLRLGKLDWESPYQKDNSRPYDVLEISLSRVNQKTGHTKLQYLNFGLTEKPGGRRYEVKAQSIKPVGVNWEAVRKWVGQCADNHGLCSDSSDRVRVPGFKIIDCRTGVVGPLLDNTAPYVALSYVWGHQKGARVDYPQTVLDSIEAVRTLGLRYLWVDRIEDSIHKLTQIEMMDQIYLRAHLTIISCSDDAEQGLPGVSKLARKVQPPLWLGDRKLELKYSPRLSAFRSRWSTRGWTYQETFFSRRKLFFTEEGVAFWCASMDYEEGVNRPLPNLDEVPRTDPDPDALSFLTPIPPSSDSRRLNFACLIEEYTGRSITFDCDALNACLGILNYLGYKHLWGVAVYEETFTMELCWYLVPNRDPGRGGGIERKDFPSWSWTRWAAPVYFAASQRPSSISAIRTRLPGGEDLDIVRDPSYKGNLGTICSGKTLRITGVFLKSHSFDIKRRPDSTYYLSMLTSACGAIIEIKVFQDASEQSNECTATHLNDVDLLEVEPLYKHSSGKLSGKYLLIKKHMVSYRRIGVAIVEEMYNYNRSDIERVEQGVVPLQGCKICTIDLI